MQAMNNPSETYSESALTPAADLAALNKARFPNESPEYRAARNALLAEEIELRRHAERVAAQRRRLPPGGEVTKTYAFVGENGPVTLADLFDGKQSLVIYKYMFGPERERPCPMCTSLMGAFEHKVPDLLQRIGLAFVARSPIERLLEWKAKRGWTHLPVYSDPSGDWTRDYIDPADGDVPGYTDFTRKDGTIRPFWSGEIGGDMADPGQDPRGNPEMDPLWLVLDTVPEGRGADWYPKLDYPAKG
jgi:predicted dithiol-disulfide oxidoreductase (DUF899 family)